MGSQQTDGAPQPISTYEASVGAVSCFILHALVFVLFFLFVTRSHVAQAGLERLILWSLPPKGWNCRRESPS